MALGYFDTSTCYLATLSSKMDRLGGNFLK